VAHRREFAQRLKQTEAQLATDNAEFSVENADIANAARSVRPRRRRLTGSKRAKRRAARRSSSIRRTAAFRR
jgi:hypothetical protein